ncbi:hypothetical protein K431DRAFT_234989 [Polychaeton citri CBS 116435]|uniref:S-adenosyl-L-methionine-dependent methyltransferase n=1 Tax=Polychaeton citri CBS 116435 TaxID=1314669 RepID=A0A9P4UKB5_9PEZI|nr:hypothetical protein K431DRAFT_234989 [Polychaeton citri CBS 116435]
MLPTPNTSHVSFDNIYEPAEDSYLLLDTLSSESESSFLKLHFPIGKPSPIILEVGTGSGVVLAFVTAHASHIFGRADGASFGIDVNAFACKATAETVAKARRDVAENATTPAAFIDVVNGDLTAPLRANCIDVLIFNPPYVPTEALSLGTLPDVNDKALLTSLQLFERDSRLLELSYAGGVDGMQITDRLLAQLPYVLSEKGVAYVLLCAQNKPEDVKRRVIEGFPVTDPLRRSWAAETVGSSGKKAGWEKLVVIRIWCDTVA